MVRNRRFWIPFTALGLTSLVWASSQTEAPEKTLIVPVYGVYGVDPAFRADVELLETSGRPVTIRVDEYTSDGELFSTSSDPTVVEAGSSEDILPFGDLGRGWINDGWVRMTFPADREVHAVSRLNVSIRRDVQEGDYTRQVLIGYRSSLFQAVPPARSFLLFGLWRGEDGTSHPRAETALVIVNPTDIEQSVAITFRISYPGPERSISRVWEIGPRSKISRFVTELLPVKEEALHHHLYVTGFIRVSGETEIAVNALEYFWNSGRFQSIPVAVDPTD